MEPTNKKTRETKPKKPSAAINRPGETAANKVPETAENFEHVLRRITIEKTRGKTAQ